MKLDGRLAAHAMAISAGMGAGLLEAYSAIDSSRNQFGRACQGGLLAVQLAKEGVSGTWRSWKAAPWKERRASSAPSASS
ncbi:Uncharacterised protein [Xylophilus ampelinus]|nr:Uncharacterised protein [Xylophilus ampelinus]|tara:strand:- start:561 stop:800 length:240 start_codon:yes stop_codon:yes gene_type:complete